MFAGISYLTHAEAKPTRVTDFNNIERITTTILGTPKDTSSVDNKVANSNSNNITNSPVSHKKSDKRSGSTGTALTCNCNDIKTQLKIKVTGNAEDLAITCNGVKTAESIADLVDGYCKMVHNSEMSFWDRTCKLLYSFLIFKKIVMCKLFNLFGFIQCSYKTNTYK